jgi:hypothetical protein
MIGNGFLILGEGDGNTNGEEGEEELLLLLLCCSCCCFIWTMFTDDVTGIATLEEFVN